MKNFTYIFYCNPIFKTILLMFFSLSSNADFDTQRNKSMEERLHSIYRSSYSRQVVDSDWFKMVEGVDQQTHTVKPKDTLWSISKIYFGDGFFWSKLWSVNGRITNPHLILVGDQIHFTVGNPKAPPTVKIQKGNSLAESDDEDRDEGEFKTSGELADGVDAEGKLAIITTPQKSVPIPDIFKNRIDLSLASRTKAETMVLDRPNTLFNLKVTVTKDILSEGPEPLGKIVSLGKNRQITGQLGYVIIESTGNIKVGQKYSILSDDDQVLDSAHGIKVLGTVQILEPTGDSDGQFFKAQVIDQFDSFKVNAVVSSYQVQKIDLQATGTVAQTPFTVLDFDNRSLWGREEIVLIKATNGGGFNVGDLLRVKNYLDPEFKTLYNSGLLKVATVSGSYAAAVVLYSNTEITSEDSISGL